MSRTLSLIIYNLLLPLGLVLMAPGALLKMRRRGGRWGDFCQRLGLYSPETLLAIASLPRGGLRFWVHAVSVGEVNVAVKIIRRLLAARVDCGVVLTTTTPTGHRLAEEFAQRQHGRVTALYSPLDFPFVATRVLEEIQPSHLVLVEAEIWPNLVTAAKKLGIPVSLVNARLSTRSEKRFRFFGFLVRPLFSALDQVMVQDREDVRRWEALGVRGECIRHTGSVKFDPDAAAVDSAVVERLRRVLDHSGADRAAPVMLAASTHAGEELEIAKVFVRLREKVPGLLLLIVPRHVERSREIAAELKERTSLKPVLRTALGAQPPKTDCVIVDTTGELAAWQHLASVVVIGKSFLAEGGQNPAEALLAGRPVVFGPHMENFDLLVQLLLAEKGAVQVTDFEAMEGAVLRLLTDADHSEDIARAGQDALHKHEGATQKTVERLLSLHR
jgi:3-deoxy-D-manno-octulosonic-acid transferase